VQKASSAAGSRQNNLGITTDEFSGTPLPRLTGLASPSIPRLFGVISVLGITLARFVLDDDFDRVPFSSFNSRK
jgi:hypothetical protein